MTVNSSDIVKLARRRGVPNAREAFDVFTDIIKGMLVLDEPVNIRNFGAFDPRVRKPVKRKNPQTGEPIEVPEKKTVVFRPAEALRRTLNDEGG